MSRTFSSAVLIASFVFAAVPGYGEELAPADRYKIVAGSMLSAGIKMTMGSRGLPEKLDVPAGASVGQLTFDGRSTLKILPDDTLTATSEGITAKDNKGATWESRAMELEGDTVYGFLKKK